MVKEGRCVCANTRQLIKQAKPNIFFFIIIYIHYIDTDTKRGRV